VQPLQPPAKTLESRPSVRLLVQRPTLSVFTLTTAESHHQPGQDHVNGVASFDLVHHHRADDRIFLYAFDLIELNGNDLAGGSAR
jgi:ATP-dependent DNA ligase